MSPVHHPELIVANASFRRERLDRGENAARDGRDPDEKCRHRWRMLPTPDVERHRARRCRPATGRAPNKAGPPSVGAERKAGIPGCKRTWEFGGGCFKKAERSPPSATRWIG